MSEQDEYRRLMQTCSTAGGAPGAGGSGGAEPVNPRYPGAYGCPSDCIGMHLVGDIIKDGVAAGLTVDIDFKPAKRSQLARLFVPEDVVNNFRGVDMVIGVEPFFLNKGEFSFAHWMPNTICPDARRIIWDKSEEATLTIRNKTLAAASFEATGVAYMLAP